MKKIVFLFTILLMILMPTIVNADTDLTIMPIDTSDWGDSTLLESGGEYLLIDVTYGYTTDVLDFLKEKNITEFDLYLSHYHSDHYGAQDGHEVNGSFYSLMEYLLLTQNKGTELSYTIDKLYLPDQKICEEYETEKNEYLCLAMYDRLSAAASSSGTEVVILGTRKGTVNSFTFGNTTAEVLYIADELSDVSEIISDKSAIQNNSSLVTMFTNGKTKFLTAGDIEKVTEDKILALDLDITADIYKMSHHGLQYNTEISNTAAFVNKVKPKYSYYQFKLREEIYNCTSSTIMQSINNLSSFSNIYTNEVNGDISFVIKNDVITPIVEQNGYSVTINYKDKENDQILDTRTYRFSRSLYEDSEYVEDKIEIKYHLYDYEKEFAGYTAEPNNSIQTSGVLKNNVTYDIYYTKQLANPETGFNMGYELLIPIVLICGITYIIIRKK